MKSLLEKIYNDRTLMEMDIQANEEYKKLLADYMSSYQIFSSALENEERERLEKLLDGHGELEGVLQKHYFKQGFRLGIKLFLEAMI